MKNAKSNEDNSKFTLSDKWNIKMELKIANTKEDNEINKNDKLKNLYFGSSDNL